MTTFAYFTGKIHPNGFFLLQKTAKKHQCMVGVLCVNNCARTENPGYS
jgi:hypothetical protein